ncbi:MAG TPA: hypothetical protein VFZ17_12580 [Acidimicrobiia bacterium]|nr:hypothetical protein [Acidimicrobiia bacterium]
MTADGRGLGRGAVRALAILGVLLIALSAIGWWLSTRVLDANGFADVVTKSSQREEVRDYIADQATLRLAKSSNFVSAARPVVADAISEAITAAPVQEAVYDFAAGAHDQIFRISTSSRANVSSAQAAVTVRAALDAINPALSKKLPANVLDATTTISQNTTVDRLFRATKWIRALYIPVLLIGIAVLAFTLARARDRVHAIRAVGVILAVAGALLLGVGAATPVFAAAAATNDPGRGEAVAQFIDVLVGRLVGAGRGMLVVGLAIALAPGHDGGDLRDRADRVRAWFAARRLSPRWRFAGGLSLALVAVLALMVPSRLFELALYVAAILLLYVGIVVCLRASGVLVTDHTIKRLHKREVALVFAALVAGALVTSSGAVSLVAASTEEAKANPSNQGCNGYIELCAQSVDQIVWPGSHNAMSSAAYDFFGAEHTISVAEQLNAGVRFLMLDAYYGYDDHGLVRTNLAGGANRAALAAEQGPNAVRELDRLGALTGTADTSGEKKDVYFCHDFCELGAVPSAQVLGEIRDFLDRNLTDVVIIDVEDYVTPKDFRQALIDADLLDRVWTPKTPGVWPSLHELVVPKKKQAEQNEQRLIVMFEKQPSKYRWLLNTYQVSEETPYNFKTVDSFSCDPYRGKTGKSLFIVNHWINPGGLPDPVRAGKTNSAATLTRRSQACIAERNKLPNTFAVNFTVSGDLFSTVNKLNAAVARQTGVTARIDETIDCARASGTLTRTQRKDINALKRLPRIGEKKARALLGPLADSLAPPKGLDQVATPREECDTQHR